MNYSKQREQILKCIEESHAHPTAEEIYESLKKDNPKLSLGTVYRNLELLYNNGLICKITSKFGADRYDAEKRSHYHAECIKCGEVDNIIMEKLDNLNAYASKKLECEVISHNIVFNTLCKKCKEKECVVK